MRHYQNAAWSAVWPAAWIAGVCASPLMALPPDPQRPFVAQDCPTALARLDEANLGNPLLSPNEMTQVVARARAQARRLCAGPALPDMSKIAPLPEPARTTDQPTNWPTKIETK